MKILAAMQDYPDRHRLAFKEAWDRAVNRFSMEFMLNFMSADGSINWRELLQYNSGSTPVLWKTFSFEAAPGVRIDTDSLDATSASSSAHEESETPYQPIGLPPLLVAEP